MSKRSCARDANNNEIPVDDNHFLNSRYTLIQALNLIGGAFGSYRLAVDNDAPASSQRRFIQLVDSERYGDLAFRSAFRKIEVYRNLPNKSLLSLDNVICYTDFQSTDPTKLYLIYDMMDMNLQQLIDEGLVFTDEHMRFFTRELLEAVAQLHQVGIVHGNLSPKNIYIDADWNIKLGGFEHAGIRKPSGDYDMINFDGAFRRGGDSYRAPELIVNRYAYAMANDIWSVAAILVKMWTKNDLFSDSVLYLFGSFQAMVDVLGRVPNKFLQTVESTICKESTIMLEILADMEPTKTTSLSEQLPGADPDFVDLLVKMLNFVPEKRITAFKTLSHSYLQSDDEPTDPFISQAIVTTDGDINELGKAEILRKIVASQQ